MKLARVVYLVAGVYGLLALVPQYVLEAKNGRDFPPPINHPEWFYGFVGVGVAWQLAFLLISRDPARYRPLMPVTFVEKLSYAVAVAVLFALGRTGAFVLATGAIDALLCALFVAAYVKTPSAR